MLGYAALGWHRSGTEGGRRTIDHLVAQLREIGLDAVVEPFGFPQFLPRRAALQLPGQSIAAFPCWYSGCTGPAGVTGRLVDVGAGTEADFARRDLQAGIALAAITLRGRAEFTNLAEARRHAAAAGASGLVAAVQGPGNHLVVPNAESESAPGGLPTLFIGREDGRQLAARAGALVEFVVDAELQQGSSANIVVTIPGRSREVLLLGTPVNSWFTAAAERGAGIGALLSLLRLHAARAAAGRPPARTLCAVFSGGHELGFLGMQRFIEADPERIARTYAYVHLGASLAGYYDYEQADGSIARAPISDPSRSLYVSENPLLNRLVARNQLAARLMPAMSLPPSLLNPGEQRRLYAIGMPMVAMSGTTLHFHSAADTPETSSAALLEPVVKFFGGVIEDLLAAHPDEVRAANQLARRLAGAASGTPARTG